MIWGNITQIYLFPPFFGSSNPGTPIQAPTGTSSNTSLPGWFDNIKICAIHNNNIFSRWTFSPICPNNLSADWFWVPSADSAGKWIHNVKVIYIPVVLWVFIQEFESQIFWTSQITVERTCTCSCDRLTWANLWQNLFFFFFFFFFLFSHTWDKKVPFSGCLIFVCLGLLVSF